MQSGIFTPEVAMPLATWTYAHELEGVETLGEFVLRRREEIGLSQGAVAASAGIDANAVWMIETGKTKTVRTRTLQGLATALKVPIEELAKLNRRPVRRAPDEATEEISTETEQPLPESRRWTITLGGDDGFENLTDEERVATTLIRHMHDVGWEVPELAKRAGLSPQVVLRHVRSKAMPSDAELSAYASAIGLTREAFDLNWKAQRDATVYLTGRTFTKIMKAMEGRGMKNFGDAITTFLDEAIDNVDLEPSKADQSTSPSNRIASKESSRGKGFTRLPTGEIVANDELRAPAENAKPTTR